MIFIVFEPYNEYNNNNNDINDNVCFICFEKKSAKGYMPINLKNQSIYINTCICDGKVHNECLKSWISFNKSCPICRHKVIEINNCNIILFNYIPFGIYIYLLIKQLTIKKNLVKIASIFLIIYLILDVYFFYFKYKRYYKDIPINHQMINNLEFNSNKITYYNITFNDITYYDIKMIR